MYVVELQNSNGKKEIQNSLEKLKSGKVVQGINSIDSFTFTMLPSNVGFNQINDYTTLISVYNTNHRRYEFQGRVLHSNDEMTEGGNIYKEVICESFFGFFCDSQQEYIPERNWTVGGLFQHIINKHNSRVENFKQFKIGEVTVTDPNDNVYIGIQYKNTWDTIKEKLLDKLGGELRFRVEADGIYIDYVQELGRRSETEIALSKNMKSLVRERDASAIVTRLIPLGCKKTAIDDEGNEYETEYRLDISDVNGGKNYVDDEDGIALYGIREGIVEFDDVTVKTTLMRKGEDWLKANNRIRVTYTATALDLSLIGLDIDDFDITNYHPIKNKLIFVDDVVRIIKKSIDVCDELKSTIEFGDNYERLSEALKRKTDALSLITSNYVTNVRFTNAINKTSTLIEQTEEKIRLEMTAEYEDLTQYMAELRLDIDGITQSVTQGDIKAQLDLKINRDELVSEINAKANVITITSDNFKLEANGKITATEGDIGGWKIAEDGLYSRKDTYMGTGEVLDSYCSEVEPQFISQRIVSSISYNEMRIQDAKLYYVSNLSGTSEQYDEVSIMRLVVNGKKYDLYVNLNTGLTSIAGADWSFDEKRDDTET